MILCVFFSFDCNINAQPDNMHMTLLFYKFYTSFCSSYLDLENLSHVIIALGSPHINHPCGSTPSYIGLTNGLEIKFNAKHI